MNSINTLAPASLESNSNEKLTSPTHVLTVLNSGIGKYELEGQPTVYVPMIYDQVQPPVFFENIEHEKLTVEQKTAIVAGLLATGLSITSVINQVLNHVDCGIPIPDINEIAEYKNIKPKFSIAIVGRSNIGKTTLVKNLATIGWPTLNLDAVKIVSPDGSTRVHDETKVSTQAIMDTMSEITRAELQNEKPVILDTGGFTHKQAKYREDEPSSLIAAAQDIVLVVDQARGDMTREDDPELANTIDTAVLQHTAFLRYMHRNFISHSLYGDPLVVAKDISTFLEDNIDTFTTYVQRMRLKFALDIALSIEDNTENTALINKLEMLYGQAVLNTE